MSKNQPKSAAKSEKSQIDNEQTPKTPRSHNHSRATNDLDLDIKTPRTPRSRKDSQDAKTPCPTDETSSRSFEEPDGTESVVVSVGKKKLYLHMDYLSIWSPVFKQIFKDNEGKKEVEIEEPDENIFKEFIECLYPPHKIVNDDNVDDVIALASKYETEELRDRCEVVFAKRSPSIKRLRMAQDFKMPNLQELIAKGCANMTLEQMECSEDFDKLDEQSRMLLFRERALQLEDDLEEVDDAKDRIYKLLKCIISQHDNCKSDNAQNRKFGSISIWTKDAKGKKRKEFLKNSAYVPIQELNPKCKECMLQLSDAARQQTAHFENKGYFSAKIRKDKDESFCSYYFKYDISKH